VETRTQERQDGKIIIRMLMREMIHRTPSVIFHPTNATTSPVPRDINNINNGFPKTPASYDDFFDQMINRENTNQRTFMKVTTMNNFMMIMSRNKERRQEVPIREIQQTSTPTSTITNSQFSLSQQSTSANKRKIDGIADDETTAASTTVIGTDPSTEEDDIDAMLEEQSDAIEEIRTEQEETMDVSMTDNDEMATRQQQ
jgi:hypothetical protein